METELNGFWESHWTTCSLCYFGVTNIHIWICWSCFRFCLRGLMSLGWNSTVLDASIPTWVLASGGHMFHLISTLHMVMGKMLLVLFFPCHVRTWVVIFDILHCFPLELVSGKYPGSEGLCDTCPTTRWSLFVSWITALIRLLLC